MNKIKNNIKLMVISIFLGTIISLAFGTAVYSENIQRDVANSVVRFHVLANSDKTDDIALKLKVRDDVLEYLRPYMYECEDMEFALSKLNTLLPEITEVAKNTVNKSGYNYDVSVSISSENFPTKYYGDISFPCGKYTALRILIGEAKGHNWWCVMYPPLCLTEETYTFEEDNEKMLKNVLKNESYEVVVLSGKNNAVPKAKFKLVEIWQNIKLENN